MRVSFVLAFRRLDINCLQDGKALQSVGGWGNTYIFAIIGIIIFITFMIMIMIMITFFAVDIIAVIITIFCDYYYSL